MEKDREFEMGLRKRCMKDGKRGRKSQKFFQSIVSEQGYVEKLRKSDFRGSGKTLTIEV